MHFAQKYKISNRIIWFVIAICVFPLILNFIGIDFGTVTSELDPYKITQFVNLEGQDFVRDILLGRNFHTIFVAFTIAIAFLTAILAFIDYRIKGDVSTPIVGIALFCSGVLDTFHILVSTQVIHIPNQQFYITSFTWFFCRVFHATILTMGVGIFLVREDLFLAESKRNARRFVINIAIVFVLLTVLTIVFLLQNSNIPRIVYPYRNIARPYDLIPLGLYLLLAFYLLPKFYEKHPSIFSQTLLLSALPAIATQIYMAFGSHELFDNNFNIAHFMTAFTYFIPFVGIGLNYLQTHKSEQRMIVRLDTEAEEKKHVQETLSGVLNSSLSSIMGLKVIRNGQNSIDDFELTILNPASKQIFGLDYKSANGKRLSRELPFVTEEGWFELLKEVVRSDVPLNHEYFSNHLQKWLLISAVKSSAKGGDNHSEGHEDIAVTISDISKRKNALKELMDMEKLTMTGRIARNIAHEVRNPLTNINMSLEQIKDTIVEPDESLVAYIEIIQRNSERINQLITELLNSARVALFEMKEYPVNLLIDETLERALDRIHLKKIKLEKHFNHDVLPVVIDVDKMKTAFLNIIINAVEAMEEGKGILTISTRMLNGYCNIEIRDNGSGIKQESIDLMFEPYFSNKSQGMGLGLFATRNIILVHKGTIDVKSVLGKGTTFNILLDPTFKG